MNEIKKPTVYLETSTISFLAAREPRDLIRKSKQMITQQWWSKRDRYELFISTTVLEEIQEGDPNAAKERIRIATGVEVLSMNEKVNSIAQAILTLEMIPQSCKLDAFHIAFATVYGIDYLVTWNQKHLANPVFRRKIEDLIISCEYQFPLIVTPELID